jgi:hypothetical protein
MNKTRSTGVESILANPAAEALLKRYAPLLEGSTGGTCQRIYSKLDRCDPNLTTVLSGLNGRLSDSWKRANKRDFDFNLSLSDVVKLWIKQQGRCAVTGRVMSFKSGSLDNKNAYSCSIDRINNRRGYVRGNVRLVTHWANNAKSTWGDDLFDQMISEVIEYKNSKNTNTPLEWSRDIDLDYCI